MTGEPIPAQRKPGRWSVRALALMMYPFAAGAAAVNLFFLSLMGQAIGLRALSTIESVIGGIILGVPFAWIAGRWLRGLMDQADNSAS